MKLKFDDSKMNRSIDDDVKRYCQNALEQGKNALERELLDKAENIPIYFVYGSDAQLQKDYEGLEGLLEDVLNNRLKTPRPLQEVLSQENGSYLRNNIRQLQARMRENPSASYLSDLNPMVRRFLEELYRDHEAELEEKIGEYKGGFDVYGRYRPYSDHEAELEKKTGEYKGVFDIYGLYLPNGFYNGNGSPEIWIYYDKIEEELIRQHEPENIKYLTLGVLLHELGHAMMNPGYKATAPQNLCDWVEEALANKIELSSLKAIGNEDAFALNKRFVKEQIANYKLGDDLFSDGLQGEDHFPWAAWKDSKCYLHRKINKLNQWKTAASGQSIDIHLLRKIYQDIIKVPNEPMFTKVIRNLQKKVPLTIVSTTNVRNWALRKCMLDEMQKNKFGVQKGAFLAEPFFEAMFPWELNDISLENQVQHNEVHSLIQNLHTNKRDVPYTHLFKHQATALRHIREGKSIVVTTGTGSGKTECFMYPIFDYLARQVDANQDVKGVQALFLYPLNALIESQGDRFKKFCQKFNSWCVNNGKDASRVHFANYTGKMKNTYDEAIQQRLEDARRVNPNITQQELHDRYLYPSHYEIIDRETLRSNPPQFLITNSTMLELAMIRKPDAPLFNGNSLKYIVIDEVHTYSGSNAAELALRLRRVLEAFGKTPNDVQFIATSASIGDDAKAIDRTKRFMADISGVEIARIEVISGNRNCENLVQNGNLTINDLIQSISNEDLAKQERKDVFLSCQRAIEFRNEILQQKRMDLTSVQDFLGLNSPDDALNFLDYASECGFIPLKAHIFQEQFYGIWACCNPECSGKQNALLNEEWKYGKVFFDLQKIQKRVVQDSERTVSMYACPCCGHNVFLTVNCQNCGEIYLAAQTEGVENGNYIFRIPKLLDEIDEIELDEDDNENYNGGRNNSEVRPALLHADDVNRERWTEYVAEVNQNNDGPVHIAQNNERPNLRYMMHDGVENRCTNCKAVLHIQNTMDCYGGFPLGKGTNISGFSVPAKSLYNSLVNDVLCEDPIAPNDNLPFDGKKILTFTDSRQGSATFAGKQSILAEMEATRVWIFDKLQTNTVCSANDLCKRIGNSIRHVKDQMNGNNQNVLSYNDCFHIPQDIDLNERRLAKLFLWREITFRSRRKRSLESLGLMQVNYEGLDQIHAPQTPELDYLHFTDDGYQKFLKVLLDFGFRQHGAIYLNSWPYSNIKKCYGSSIHPGAVDASAFFIDQFQDDPNRSTKNAIAKIALYYIETKIDQNANISQLIRNKWLDIRTLIKQALDNLVEAEILCDDNGKYHIDFSALSFNIPNEVWLCPATSSLLDVLIENPVSGNKYTPFIFGISNPIRLPVTTEPIQIRNVLNQGNWIDNANALRNAYMGQNWWSDLHETLLKSNPSKAFVVAQENTAQISAEQRSRDQHMFIDGKINVMNCSTTMEMGVDIGDISLVAMTNIPPHEYNYLQRAGRAGRSDQTQSLVWTLGSFGKHEREALEDPLAWVNSNTVRANVSHYGKSILQRHVNAYLFGTWLRNQNIVNAHANACSIFLSDENNFEINLSNVIIRRGAWDNAPTTETFEQNVRESSAASPISNFLRQIDAMEIPDALLNPFGAGDWNPQELKDYAKDAYRRAQEKWISKLCEYYGIINQNNATTISYQVLAQQHRTKVCYYLRKMLVENSLNMLIKESVLPANGMPIDVVELDLDPSRQTNNYNDSDNPSRERKIAVREYAPGASVIIDAKRHVSRGIEFEGMLYGRMRDATLIRSYFTCDRCGSPVIEQLDADRRTCGVCGNIVQGIPRQIVEPLKFLAYEEDKSVDSVAKIPYEMPHIKLYKPETELFSFEGQEIMQISWGRAKVVFLNGDGNAENENKAANANQAIGDDEPPMDEDEGQNAVPISKDDHYRLCTHCGFIYSDKGNATNYSDMHRKFSAYWNRNHECANIENYDKHRLISLAAIVESRALVIHIPELRDEIAATTWALALRNALAERLSIDYSELGWTSQKHGFSTNGRQIVPSYDIILFDNAAGGSDYCLEARNDLVGLFAEAKRHLECHANCDSICLECLLSRETQVMSNHLNRNIALSALNDDFFAKLQVPEEKRYWGGNTHFMQSLYSYMQNLDMAQVQKIRFYLSNNVNEWNFVSWDLKNLLRSNENKVEFAIEHDFWLSAETDDFQKTMLNELMYFNRNFGYVENMPTVNDNAGNVKHISMEILKGDSIYQYVFENTEDNSDLLFWHNPQKLRGYYGLTENETPLIHRNVEDLHFAATSLRLNAGERFQIEDFAKQLLARVCNNAEALPMEDILRIEYYDRYMQTPMALRVLGEIIKFLRPNEFVLYTSGRSFSERNNYARYQQPWHNVEAWCCDYPNDTRTGAYRQIFYKETLRKISNIQNISVHTNGNIQHDREMSVVYRNGERRLIRFTGGMGMWYPSEDINYWNGAMTKQPCTIGIERDGRLSRTINAESDIISNARNYSIILKDSTSIIVSRENREA